MNKIKINQPSKKIEITPKVFLILAKINMNF